MSARRAPPRPPSRRRTSQRAVASYSPPRLRLWVEAPASVRRRLSALLGDEGRGCITGQAHRVSVVRPMSSILGPEMSGTPRLAVDRHSSEATHTTRKAHTQIVHAPRLQTPNSGVTLVGPPNTHRSLSLVLAHYRLAKNTTPHTSGGGGGRVEKANERTTCSLRRPRAAPPAGHRRRPRAIIGRARRRLRIFVHHIGRVTIDIDKVDHARRDLVKGADDH